jgi:uncharacterized protein YkwD
VGTQDGLDWATATGTAAPMAPPSEGCDAGDLALEGVAARLARRAADGLAPPTSAELAFTLRAHGSPHVWPRGWTLSNDDPRQARARLARFITSVVTEGHRFCGIASLQASGRDVHAAVVVDVLAELEPIPTRVRSGRWIEVRARLLVPATDPFIVVLGPRGRPRRVPSSHREGRVTGRFAADQPGHWVVQVVSTLESGPRPVLEAIVAVDEDPPPAYVASPAPGESSVPRTATDTEALVALLAAARAEEGLGPLTVDPRLQAVAGEHAEHMQRSGRLSHDAGAGGPLERLARAGLDGIPAGENVAHAPDALRAHRALWSSPSHRGNILDPRFDSVGIGVARDPDGSIWVCQLFAKSGRPALPVVP